MENQNELGFKSEKSTDHTHITHAYPFEAMKIKDSFIAGKHTEELESKINEYITFYTHKLNCKYSTNKVDEYLRVSRIE